MSSFILSLGSNKNDRFSFLKQGLLLLKTKCEIEKYSSIYETSPVDCEPQANFYNMCVSGNTNLNPYELLYFCESIEKELGRENKRLKKAREIDIDIVFYSNQIIHSELLKIPHPRYRERLFVLKPLIEIKPEQKDPITNTKVIEHLEDSIQKNYENQFIKLVSKIV